VTQAHWIRDARYTAELLDADGDTIKRFYARTLREVAEEVEASEQAVCAKANNLRTGEARVIRR
jgi:hypothetical protein